MSIIQPIIKDVIQGVNGGTILPTDIADLALWLDADEPLTIIKSGNEVSQWNDRSIEGFDITQVINNSIARPMTEINTINGRNTISFDGVGNFFDGNSGNYSIPTVSHTIIIVCHIFSNIDAAIDCMLGWNISSFPHDKSIICTKEGSGVLSLLGELPISGNINIIDENIQNQDIIVSLVFDHDVNSQVTSYLNGVQKEIKDIQIPQTPNKFLIGAEGDGLSLIPSNFIIADMGEIIIYDRALLNSERESMEQSLSQKWGIPVG